MYKGTEETEDAWYARYLSEAVAHAATRSMKDKEAKPYYLFDLEGFLRLDLYVNDEGIDVTGLEYDLRRSRLN